MLPWVVGFILLKLLSVSATEMFTIYFLQQVFGVNFKTVTKD